MRLGGAGYRKGTRHRLEDGADLIGKGGADFLGADFLAEFFLGQGGGQLSQANLAMLACRLACLLASRLAS